MQARVRRRKAMSQAERRRCRERTEMACALMPSLRATENLLHTVPAVVRISALRARLPRQCAAHADPGAEYACGVLQRTAAKSRRLLLLAC